MDLLAVLKAHHQSHDQYVLLSCRCLFKKSQQEALSEALIPQSKPDIAAVADVTFFVYTL